MSARPPDPDDPVFGPCARCRRVKELDQEGLCVECCDAQAELMDRPKRRRPRGQARSTAAYQRERYWQDPAKGRAQRRARYWRHRERYTRRMRDRYWKLRGSRDGKSSGPDVIPGKGG